MVLLQSVDGAIPRWHGVNRLIDVPGRLTKRVSQIANESRKTHYGQDVHPVAAGQDSTSLPSLRSLTYW